ncbi:hypothetical protein OO17_27425 [Rhodopseudomonas palustris]|uniref:Uncharacterized protein n=1 Tax=Rhodopseudomonas palustris TaxID=1076 RepID=A0A0D7DZP7_RHOPL|nr:hypothetical protein OO17_27425 [Rhodopseudomonas palustris]
MTSSDAKQAGAYPLTRPPAAATLSHEGRGKKLTYTTIITGFSISSLGTLSIETRTKRASAP